jgi:hypothetical protein
MSSSIVEYEVVIWELGTVVAHGAAERLGRPLMRDENKVSIAMHADYAHHGS